MDVNALPAAPTITSPVDYCVGEIATPLTATGTSLLWYTVATGGTGSATAPTPSTAAAGTTSYWVSQTDANTCESPRAEIVVDVNALPAAPTITSPVDYCVGETATPLTATGTNLLWYTVATGGTGSATAPTPSTAAAGTTSYWVSQTDANTCESPRAEIVVDVNALPAAPTITSPVDYCVGETATPLTATGTSLLWYTVATGGTGSATAPTPSTAAAGTTSYWVSQTDGNSCEGPRAEIVVDVNALPAAPTITSPVDYCVGETATPLTATGTSLLWYTVATGGTGSATAPTPSTAAAGTTSYWVSQTDANTCESPRAEIVVDVDALPAAPTITSPVDYCVGETATPLTATGTNLLWYTIATGGTGSATAPTPSTAAAGTTSYWVSQTDANTCESPRAEIVVDVNALPAAPTITSPVDYCVGETATPLTATGTSLLWYTVATGGTGSATAPTPSTAAAGTTSYWVSQTDGNSCEGPRAEIVVDVNALPAAPTITSPVDYCVGETATPLTATGTNLLWYTVATGGTGNATAPTPSTAAAGTTSYWVSQTDANTCESPRAEIVVDVNALPAAPTITSPVDYCVGETATPLTATGTNLLWYTIATGGTGSATAPTPSTAAAGTTSYWVSQTDANTCESPRAEIVVDVNALPAAPTITSPVDYCVGEIATPLTATGTSLLWYTVATGGTGNATAPTPSTAAAGTTSYWVSQTDANTCESPRAEIVVDVNALPAAPTITSPVDYCVGEAATPLTATGTSLLWYTVATGGTGNATAPTPSTAAAGTTSYWVSQTDANTCESPRAEIVVDVNALPAAPTITSPVDYCVGEIATPLTATGTSLLWYTVATGGTGSATAPTPSTAAAGTTSYWVSQTDANTCESPRAEIVVDVNALPAAPTITSPVDYCVGETATPLTATGTNLLWYTIATGGTGSATAPTPSTAAAGTTSYWVSQTDANTCESPRAEIVVDVNALPAAPTITSPVDYCVGEIATPLTATGTSLLWYTVATGGTGSATAPTPSTAAAGTTSYWVSQTDANTCESPRAEIVVDVNALPAAPTITSPVDYCVGEAATPLTATGTSLLWYTVATGGTGNATAPTPSTAAAGTTSYWVSQTDANTCESPRAEIVVDVNALPAAPTITSPVDYCVGEAATPLTATGTSLLWYTVATGGTGNATAPTPSTAAAGTTSYWVSQTDANTCESPRAEIVVDVNALPAAPTITSPVDYCVGEAATPLTATGTSLLWYTVATGGTGNATAPTPSTAAAGTTSYWVSQTDANTCESPRAEIVVDVNALPAAPTITSPVDYCVGEAATPLTATGTSLLWYTVATGGTGNATAPTPSTAAAGTTSYWVSQTDANTCESPRAEIVVDVNALPAAPTITSPVDYCVGEAATPLTATGTSLLWYTVATGGTGNATAPTPSTAAAGTTSYWVSQTDANTCESPRAEIVVDVNALPAAPTITSPVDYCVGETATPLTATGTSLLWYTVATGGTGSATAPTPSTAAAGTTSYWVSQTDANTCESPRAEIVVDVNALPAAPTITSPVDYCVGETATPLTATGTSLLWYTVATGGTGSATAPTPSTAAAGTTSYWVSQTDANTCESPRAEIVVDVNVLPNVIANASVTTINSGEPVILYGSGADSYSWDNGVLDGNTIFPSVTTTYTVTGTNSNGCENTDWITIVVNDGAGTDVCPLIFFNEFTPNNDGLNDVFYIDCLEQYPDNILRIYNRWGGLVYQKQPYDNTWDGTAMQTIANGEDEKLPDGTYYYVFELGTDTGKPLTGWIYISQ